VSAPIKPELSRKNRYWIPKYRHYELKYFCLQYNEWKKLYSEISMLRTAKYNDSVRTKQIIDPTLRIVEMRQLYSNRINLIEETAEKTDTDLSVYILKGITEGLSYDSLRLRFNIPCSKDTYYDRYRRFFWILDKRRE
jgi:hypothetical protein